MALCVIGIAGGNRPAWSGQEVGFVVRMDGTWRSDSPSGKALQVGQVVRAGTLIHPPEGTVGARIEIALYQSGTLLDRSCGEVVGCSTFKVGSPHSQRSNAAQVLKAVQKLFEEDHKRYEIVLARTLGSTMPIEVQSTVLANVDGRFIAVPPLSTATSGDGRRTLSVRPISASGRLGAPATATIVVRRAGGVEDLDVTGDLNPGLYNLSDASGPDQGAIDASASLGTWVLVVSAEAAKRAQASFQNAAGALRWGADASTTRDAVLRAYLMHLSMESR